MSAVTEEMVDHYSNVIRDLNFLDPYVTDALAWVVVRGRDTRLTVPEVVSRLGGDPGAITRRVPLPPKGEGEASMEQRGDNVLIFIANSYAFSQSETLAPLTENAQAWGFWWLINNAHGLFYAADGRSVTEVNLPSFDGSLPCWGRDPHALDPYLGWLRALGEQLRREDETGEYDPPYLEREIALATVEAMSGVRLESSWFTREQDYIAHAPRLLPP
ncbi:hypothetical protein ACFLIM_46905 [Nonomuraea sp. M3C6]|uniref:SUKH-4 immunity protein n=1 Tax=Nonomuraea marmarensis TaxID=3351344 RepID=A0ABW7ATE3_9ACTN